MNSKNAIMASNSWLIVCLVLTGCSSDSNSDIDSQTGMVKMLCPTFQNLMENANQEVWDLTEFKTSVDSATKSLIEVVSDASIISKVTNEPATSWLHDIGKNGNDFLNFFSVSYDGSTEELVQIYARWKANYEELATYCP